MKAEANNWLALDLKCTPWSLPGSRLFVFQFDERLAIGSAEYEVRPQDSLFFHDIEVRTADGKALTLLEASPLGLRWQEDVVLTFGALDTLVFSAGTTPVTIRLLQQDNQWVDYSLAAHRAVGLRLQWGKPVMEIISHAHDALAWTRGQWRDWMDKCPTVAAEYLQITLLNWYCLGVNAIALRSESPMSPFVIVPSLLGYVGVWQWDAYFIGIGLATGNAALAKAQIDVALRHPTPAGQLPDVVHDFGVLAGFSDLPINEFAAYAEKSAMSEDQLRRIPITKPPLTAWAMMKIAGDDLEWLDMHWKTLVASHLWWADSGRRVGMRLPVYEHPFSSGLDDSPVFDDAGPRTSSDLLAYLILQEELLEELAGVLKKDWDAEASAIRKQSWLDGLSSLWNSELELYESEGNSETVATPSRNATDTLLTLLPLLVDEIDPSIAFSLLSAMNDPLRFGGEVRVPTVSRSAPEFSNSRMWRGPIWLSTNYLLITALERRGLLREASQLARESLRLLEGGPYEYYRADTGKPSESAVPCFSWTAALGVDLAVRYSVVG